MAPSSSPRASRTSSSRSPIRRTSRRRTPERSTWSSPATSTTCCRPPTARAFAAAAVALARPGGRLFLSTLSPRDPQHAGKGEPVAGEERSWFEHCYLHFCSREELLEDFASLEVAGLEERAYDERHADGRLHHHVSWFLEAWRPE